jgi:hypothetical protein
MKVETTRPATICCQLPLEKFPVQNLKNTEKGQ